jgi:hypothetical protein
MPENAPTPRKVLILGSGQRIVNAALPAFEALPELYSVEGVIARKEKTIATKNGIQKVEPISRLDNERIAAIDLIFICVSKAAVPTVLEHLGKLEVSRTDLLIDTPVLLFKHLSHFKKFEPFRNVWVAEDMSTLPWLDTLDLVRESESLGDPKSLTLYQSAYAYHGLALAKTLLGGAPIKSAKRRHTGGNSSVRKLNLASGKTCLIHDPRDYNSGHFSLHFTDVTICDRPHRDHMHIDGIVEEQNGELRYVGFQIEGKNGAHETRMEPYESELFGPVEPAKRDASVIAHMDAFKRVGFARLLTNIHAGKGAYPLIEAIDDMWIDYVVEKTGRWFSCPMSSARSGLARGWVGLATGLAVRFKG